MDSNIKIVFMGEDAFSNIVLSSLLKKGYNVPFVISPLYNNNIHKRLENTAIFNGIEYLRTRDVNSQTIIDKLEKIQPDLLITAHLEKLIKKDIIKIPHIGCLNLHPSLLPYYRGLAPQHWPLINGEDETGITVHFIDETADTGNIILQQKIALTDQMYVSDLQLVWAKMYQAVMCEAVEKVINGCQGVKQDKTVGSYYGKLKPTQCKIDTHGSVKNAYNLIRGVSMPYHGAYIEMDDAFFIIWKAEVISETPLAEIGKVDIKDHRQYLSFHDGTLFITKYEIRNK